MTQIKLTDVLVAQRNLVQDFQDQFQEHCPEPMTKFVVSQFCTTLLNTQDQVLESLKGVFDQDETESKGD